MRTLIISGGVEGIQRIDCEDMDFGLYSRAVAGDVEAHNALNPIENRWVWGEAGTETDPTIENPSP